MAFRAVMLLLGGLDWLARCIVDFVSITRAQRYEYYIAHFMDKNFESTFGFLNVLPGAWSAYRYQALVHLRNSEMTLMERIYLRLMLDPNKKLSTVEEKNMYLAEDRLLCLGIYTTVDNHFTLQYVPDAKAYTDPADSLCELLKQRRRWINSSNYAYDYVSGRFQSELIGSTHSTFSKSLAIPLLMTIGKINYAHSYLIPAFFFFSLYFTSFGLMRLLVGLSVREQLIRAEQGGYTETVGIIKADLAQKYDLWGIVPCAGLGIFIYLTCKMVICSLTLKLDGKSSLEQRIKSISAGMALFNILLEFYVVGFLVYYFFFREDKKNFEFYLSLVVTGLFLAFFMSPFVMGLFSHPLETLQTIASYPAYLFYRGIYSHILQTFAFCNVDDVSWGTKGLDGGSGTMVEAKMDIVLNFLLINLLAASLLIFIQVYLLTNLILYLALYGLAFSAFKTFLSVYHHFWYYLYFRCKSTPK
jgi:cellulose synthase/poly-beta-1,6-N-acetylglucosamine synthase-like glycosyltransferase